MICDKLSKKTHWFYYRTNDYCPCNHSSNFVMKRSTIKKILVLANVFGATLIIIVVLLP